MRKGLRKGLREINQPLVSFEQGANSIKLFFNWFKSVASNKIQISFFGFSDKKLKIIIFKNVFQISIKKINYKKLWKNNLLNF